MSFLVKSEIHEDYAIMMLEGALDSLTATLFKDEMQKIVLQNPRELVLDVEKLDFMASAGLRVIIFAKQKLGTAASLVMVKPQEQLIETLKMTGLIHSVTVTEKYPI